ncbi:hypothetical protein TNCV_1488011 [Trichonephila clavipes]|nr:hypothetical protein TNCV_1488011 [Trichonephila clavipes]
MYTCDTALTHSVRHVENQGCKLASYLERWHCCDVVKWLGNLLLCSCSEEQKELHLAFAHVLLDIIDADPGLLAVLENKNAIERF